MLKSSLRISSFMPEGNTTGGVPNAIRIERFTHHPSELEATFKRHDPTSIGNETVSFYTHLIRHSQLAIFIGRSLWLFASAGKCFLRCSRVG